MDMCRTCLKTPAVNDITELEKGINDNKSYLDIMVFCLDIQVSLDSKITTSLCNSCYREIITFYKFKVLSLKNDAYLKSLDPVDDEKLSLYANDDGVKYENVFDSDEFGPTEDCNSEVKSDIDVKDQDTLQDVESDVEPLSVLKKIKYEFIKDATEENAPKRKRGRPKKIKPVDNVKKKKQVCEECGKSVHKLKEHALQHRPIEERRMLQCKACSKVFLTRRGRSRHYNSKHLGVKSKCDICDKEVLRLSSHKLLVHNPEALRFSCVSCDRRFLSRAAMKLHMTIHTKQMPFECDVCHKKFRTKLSISGHIRQVHQKEKSHKCHFCPKAFYQKEKLEIHLRSHTNERPYSCEECGKTFRQMKALKNHRLIHNGVKNFRCGVCDMGFVRIEYLKAHIISHTKEKKHPCQYCGARFGRSDHRRRHEFTAHQKHLADS